MQYIVESEPVYGDDGFPSPSAPDELSEAIECNIVTNEHNRKGGDTESPASRHSYIVHVELMEFNADRIILTDAAGKKTPVLVVQDVQPLEYVGTTKIIAVCP